MSSKAMYCDACAGGFLYESIKIKETVVNIEGKELFLTYFTCPFCGCVYRVLLVEEKRYRELINDYTAIVKRIGRQGGKANPELIEKLQKMAFEKQQRIRIYADRMNKRYTGRFVLASKNNKQCVIVYLPWENMDVKGE